MIPIGDVNPRRRFPTITVLLILTNVIVFLYQLSLSPDQLQRFVSSAAIIPARIVAQPDLRALSTIITSTFMHGGVAHIVGNMLYLWIFGDNIEEMLGHGRYLVFYLLAGIVAGVAQIAVYPRSTIPTLGASGAVAGVLGAYAVLYPRARIRSIVFVFYFIRFIELPALLVLGFWFVIQLFQGVAALATIQSAGVAWFAHIGGFAMGMLAGALLRSRARHRLRPSLR